VDLKIIGIAGVARVGKDTFADNLIKYLSQYSILSTKVAFADVLKQDLREFLLAKAHIDPYTSNEKDKKQLRPILVEYGKLMRSLTQGSHWINLLEEKIEKNAESNIISVISDLRYSNEASWINKNGNGVTIHLARIGVPPANEEEKQNDPITKSLCQYQINWKSADSASELKHQVNSHVNRILHKQIIRSRDNTKT